MSRSLLRRALPLVPTLGLIWAAAPGCASKKPTAVVVAVTSETAVPAEIDGFDIEVQRGDSTPLFHTYTLPSDAHLPGTVVLQNRDGESSSDPVTVIITARLGSKTRVLRRATLGFVDEKTKLLKMPLRYSCIDFPSECANGQSCQGGVCAPDAVDVATLPDFSDELVFGRQGSSTTCFDDRATSCLASPQDVSPMALGAGCSFVVVGASSGGDMGTGGAAPVAAPDGGVTPPSDAGAGLQGTGAGTQLNVAVHWKVAGDAQRLTVLDFGDDREGWSRTASNDGVVLAPGICQAVKSGAITRIVYSTACPSKGPSQPVCESTTQGTGTGPGNGGSGGGTSSGAGGGAVKDAGGPSSGTGGSTSTTPDAGAAGNGPAPPACTSTVALQCATSAGCTTAAQACALDSICSKCVTTGLSGPECGASTSYTTLRTCICANTSISACATCCLPLGAFRPLRDAVDDDVDRGRDVFVVVPRGVGEEDEPGDQVAADQ